MDHNVFSDCCKAVRSSFFEALENDHQRYHCSCLYPAVPLSKSTSPCRSHSHATTRPPADRGEILSSPTVLEPFKAISSVQDHHRPLSVSGLLPSLRLATSIAEELRLSGLQKTATGVLYNILYLEQRTEGKARYVVKSFYLYHLSLFFL